jgi:D-alanyl-D-alanine carboxypeptidase/D-alanyl-D-alanine-endopeptidase (penicillin-binding protein 4)
LYSRDAGKLMIPASNMKIVTSAVALDALGPGFRFTTRVLAGGVVHDSSLDGDLLVEGRGDPTVSDRMAGDAMLPLLAMGDSLRAHGVRRVRGRLLASGNAFPDANAGFQWGWEDLETSSGALIDELLFNEGIAQIHLRGGERPGVAPTWRTTPARTFPPVRIVATSGATRPRRSMPRRTPRAATSWSPEPYQPATRRPST